MDNIAQLLKILSNTNNEENKAPDIPKEIIEQYPYGEFPIRYTKSGQEIIRKNSEARYSHTIDNHKDSPIAKPSGIDLSTILSLSTLLSNKKKNSQNDMLEIFSSLLFKDNPEFKKILELFSKKPKTQEIDNTNNFPNVNKVCISALKKVE